MEEDTRDSKAVTLTAKWGAKAVELTLSPADWSTITFDEFRNLMEGETDIPADKMKIIGVTNGEGKLPTKGELLKDMVFKKNDRSFMLIGTARGNFLKEPDPDDDTDIGAPVYDIILPASTLQQRLKAAIETTDLRWINNANPGKKLLVLDLDYTLFDCQGTRDMRLPISEYKRPFFDSFLKEAFESFNLCIWSQTSWTWVEAKVTELGMLNSTDYNIMFCLDQSSMFTVRAARRGSSEERTHQVKALEIIWRLCPMFGPHNTLHVDDLSRNFAMNPKNGIKVRAFRRRHRSDTELKQLTAYLKHCANLADLTQLDHTRWRDNNR
eukprot:GEMP01016323.1.p1 GENE.GEMP01016323.1~~GEMP01016323.1.p1  ORF type:complete len:325 (+),score=36.86 GEMP01016323.1:179-1153(+)